MSVLREIKPSYTYQDYKEWDGRWELIDGEPYMMASPNKKHQRLCGKIYKAFFELLVECENCEVLISPMDYLIDEYNVVQPDVLVVCNDDENKNFVKKTPKIIFEVLSFSTSRRDKKTKYRLYEDAGVKYYCIIHPDFETMNIYKLIDGIYDEKTLLNGEGKYKFDIDECKIEFEIKEMI